MAEGILAGDQSHAARVRMCRPGIPGPSGERGEVMDIFDVSVAFNASGEPGSLDLRTYKDSPGAAALQTDDLELQVDLLDPRTGEWAPVQGGRFIVDTYQEDRVDETNVIHYRCPNRLLLLEKVRVHRVPGDWRRNNALDAAEEALRDAEREYQSALRSFEDLAHRIKQRHGMWGGKVFAYHGVTWLSRYHSIPNGSIASDANQGGRLYYYHRPTWRWRRLSTAQWADDKRELRERGVTCARARRAYNRARDRFDKAERAVRETSRDGRRFFHASSPGRTLARLWNEGIERDRAEGHPPRRPLLLKGMGRSFTNARDSAGRAWARESRTSHDFQLGASLLSVLMDFRERGLIDFTTDEDTLHVVPAGGLEVDQTSRVNLMLGRELTSADERGSRMHHFSRAIVTAGNGYSYALPYEYGADFSHTEWGFWEGTVSEQDADSQDSAAKLTLRSRQQAQRRHKVESTLGVTLEPWSAIPMIDYLPGHTISVWDHESDRSARKVEQIVLTWSPEAPLTAVITLDDRFQQRATTFARTVSKTVGGVDHIQGHVPARPVPGGGAVTNHPHFAPPLTDATASVRFDRDGRPTVVLRASFADPGLPEPPDPAETEDADQLPTEETDPTEDGFDPDDD